MHSLCSCVTTVPALADLAMRKGPLIEKIALLRVYDYEGVPPGLESGPKLSRNVSITIYKLFSVFNIARVNQIQIQT